MKSYATYLELLRQNIDVTALFVVEIGIGPEELCFLFKSTPALELADSRSVISPLHAFDHLLQLLDGQRIGNDLVVISQSSRRKIDKGLKIGIVISGNGPRQ